MAVSTKSIRNKPRPTARDITARRKAQEQLQLAEENYRTIFENSSVAITIADENENIVSWNRFAEVLLGMGRHDFHMKPVSSLYPEDEWRKIRSQNVRQKGMQHHLETRIIRKNQEIVDVDLSLSILKGPDGEVIGSVGIIADITARKRLREHLQLAEANYRTIFENSSIAITMADENENIVSWNKFAETLLDMDKDDLYMKPVSSLYPEDEWRKIKSQNVRQKGMQHHLETRIIRKNQEIVDVDLSLSILKGPDGNVIGSIGVIADITARKRAQEELRGYRDHLEDLVAERTTKLATVNEQLQQEITERKQAEEELIRLSNAVEMSTDGIVISGLDARIIHANEATLRMYGTKDKSDLVGKSAFDLIALEDRETAFAGMQEAMEKGYVKTREYNIVTKDGSKLPVEMSSAIMKDAKGEPIGFVGVSRDITERKRAEEALRESEERFRRIVENAPFGYYRVGKDGLWQYVNPVWEDMYSLSSSDVIGKSFEITQPDDDKDQARELVQRALSGESITGEFSRSRNDGSIEYHSFNIQPVYQAGEVVAIEGFISDITERKQAEEALRGSEEQYSFLVGNLADAVFRFKEGVISWGNDKMQEMLGYNTSEMIGVDVNLFVSDETALSEVYKQVDAGLKTRGHFHGTTRVKKKDGSIIDIEYTASQVPGKDPIEIVGVARDITERRQAEEALRKAHGELELRVEERTADLAKANEELQASAEQLKRRNREIAEARKQLETLNERLEDRVQQRTAEVERLLTQKDEFIGVLGHDLKTPLTSIITLLFTLKKRVQDSKSSELLDAIIKNANYMKDLVVKTLQLARLDKLGTDFALDNTNLLREVMNVVEGREPVVQEKDVKIESRVDKKIVVKVDRLRLVEMLDNVISNAIKFTPENGTITIDAKEDTDFVTVSVKDTGIGITREQLDRIFDEFYKADPSRHELASSGLGLSICKRIAEKHGGKIWAESEGLGKGTTMRFTLKSGNKE